MDLQGADVERAAVPAEGPLGIQLQQHLGQAVIGRALLGPAGHVAQHLAGFLHGERDAVFAERGAQAPHVAEHVVAARNAVQEAERSAWGDGLLPGWSDSSDGTWMVGGAARAEPIHAPARSKAVTAASLGECCVGCGMARMARTPSLPVRAVRIVSIPPDFAPADGKLAAIWLAMS